MLTRIGSRALCLSLLLCVLLPTACQPIQPEAAAPPEAASAAVGSPAIADADFPVAGITLDLPAGWIGYQEPREEALNILSTSMPHNEQWFNGFWPYLSNTDNPFATLHVAGGAVSGTAPDSVLVELLQLRFGSREASQYAFNPQGAVTFVEGPTLTTIGGQPAAWGIVEATDTVLGKPFRAHVWAIRNGKRVAYLSSALLEANEAAFLPTVQQIVESVQVREPEPMDHPAPVATGEILPGETVNGEFGEPSPGLVQRHYWHFQGEPGKRYVATIAPLSPYVDPVADLVDATGETTLYYEMDNTGAGQQEQVGVSPSAAGDYYVVVRPYYAHPGDYTVNLEVLD